MDVIKFPGKKEWGRLLKRPAVQREDLENTIRLILADVKQNGDAAIRKYTQQFDHVLLEGIAVSKEEERTAPAIPENLKQAIDLSAANIKAFHKKQLPQVEYVQTMPGIECRRKPVAIEKVGLYIPGGTAPLFSSLLMLGIPARLAGCREIIVCTPADRNGNIHPAILYTARVTGIDKIYKVGGAQAIGAMAYGPETIPQVYKIFGPGNQYVTGAKQLIQQEGIAIDMPAGPSELCVLADETANASFIAADLLSQAEHGADSQVLLITTDEILAGKVTEQLNEQLRSLPRKETAEAALRNSRIIVVQNMEEGINLVNEYAPEHLIITCRGEDHIADLVINAGSVFIGTYAAESIGDYASGTNHVLPTNGFAKVSGGVSVDSFMKKISFQKITAAGLINISDTVITMAGAEGLDAHANAIKIRLNK